MITEAAFYGGAYDPTPPRRFSEQGRVILVPSAHSATLVLPFAYSEMSKNVASSQPVHRETLEGGPSIYIINNRAGTLTVRDAAVQQSFTVPAGEIAVVCTSNGGGSGSFRVETYPKNASRSYDGQAGRPTVDNETNEVIPTGNICEGDEYYSLTDCESVATTVYSEETKYADFVGMGVNLDGQGATVFLVAEAKPLPEGATLTAETIITGILEQGCYCSGLTLLGPGEKFNGYVGPIINPGDSAWQILRHEQDLATDRRCYMLYVYEGVSYNGTLYDLSAPSATYAVKTPGSASTSDIRAMAQRNAYSPQYDTYAFNGRQLPDTNGTELIVPPFKYNNVGSLGGHIGGYVLDASGIPWYGDDATHNFDTAARTAMYDLLVADYDGSPDVAPGNGTPHTLLLYVRCDSDLPDPTAGDTRPDWAASTAYALSAEIRPGGTAAFTHDLAFRVTVAGTSGIVSAEPDWDSISTIGDTLTDNGITWMAVTRSRVLQQNVYLLAAHASCETV